MLLEGNPYKQNVTFDSYIQFATSVNPLSISGLSHLSVGEVRRAISIEVGPQEYRFVLP